ncbi:excisionase family DNA binding domain-containing protein [Clostridium sp. CAG:533]|nr:excisionase family DNA binding domain-containing protein [Clostridium sp. CAG:533]
MQKNICNIKELSIYLQTSIPQIRKLVREKKIPYFRVGNRIKFDLNEINKWIEKLQEKEAEMSVFI